MKLPHLFFCASLGLLCGVSLRAGELKVDVQTRPWGSFRAESSLVQGFVEREGEAFSGKNISVDLSTLKTGLSLRDEYMRRRMGAHWEVRVLKAHAEGGAFQLQFRSREQAFEVQGRYRVAGFQWIGEWDQSLSALGFFPIHFMDIRVLDTVHIEVTLPILTTLPVDQ